MQERKRAIVLGGIVSHIPLIQKLQTRGMYVILVDYLDNPPAKRFADCHVQISTFDEEGIYRLAVDQNVSLIVNCCLEHLNPIVSRISEKLGLPCLYSEEIALDVSEKTRMKTKMIEAKVPTSKFVSVTELESDTTTGMRFPLFVKPADGSGSSGVNRAENIDELKEYFKTALSFSRSGAVIVEEESCGLECNVYCYVKNGEAQVLLIASKYSEIHNHEHGNTKCIATLAPAPIGDTARRNIANVAQRIVKGFSLNSTPMFIQLMVNGDDVSVIEFACRIPGGYSYRSILNKLGFDYFDFTLDVLLGNEPNCRMKDTGEISIVHSFYAYPCVLGAIVGVDGLIQRGEIVDINYARESGSIISDESCNREKVGHFVISAKSIDDALAKVNAFFDSVQVLDSDGNDRLRHDLRLTRDCICNAFE